MDNKYSYYYFDYEYYESLCEKVNKTLPTYYEEYGGVQAAYISSEEEFKLYSEMRILGYRPNVRGPEDFDKNYYRGVPDWYFVVGEPENRDWDSTLCFETLEEQKMKFNNFCKILDDIVKENT